MEVVLRTVNDRFLHEVAFPAFELGVVDAVAGLEFLQPRLADERTQTLIELLLAGGLQGSFFSLNEERWLETVYRLLFWEWVESERGWCTDQQHAGFASSWHDALHVALMLEQADYPYVDLTAAQQYRHSVVQLPDGEGELTQLLCGWWDPVPGFAPDQVLSISGRGVYKPDEPLAMADWSYRSVRVVNAWGAQLPNKLSRLLGRESHRLSPIQAPEAHDILDFWLGRLAEPPTLAVTFSGLGPGAYGWISQIGTLARLIRSAAATGKGLTAIVSEGGQPTAEGASADGERTGRNHWASD